MWLEKRASPNVEWRFQVGEPLLQRRRKARPLGRRSRPPLLAFWVLARLVRSLLYASGSIEGVNTRSVDVAGPVLYTYADADDNSASSGLREAGRRCAAF
jgi:hypothetical protein